MPSKIENKTKKEIDKLIRKACNSINIKWGTIKADIIIYKKNLI